MKFLQMFCSADSMWKMKAIQEKEPRWTPADHHHRVVVWCYKIFLKDGNRFCIDPIPILRCHRNRCREIRPSPAKGKFFVLIFLYSL